MLVGLRCRTPSNGTSALEFALDTGTSKIWGPFLLRFGLPSNWKLRELHAAGMEASGTSWFYVLTPKREWHFVCSPSALQARLESRVADAVADVLHLAAGHMGSRLPCAAGAASSRG